MSEDGLHTPPQCGGTTLMTTDERRSDVFSKLRPVLMPTYEALGRGLDNMASAISDAFGSLGRAVSTPSYDQASIHAAVSKLQHTRSFLDQKIVEMREKTSMFERTARLECASNNRSGALHQLRLKNMYEREAAKMETLRFNIESNILHMESVSVMMETISTIKETSAHFQTLSAHADITKLETSIEEMFEQSDTSITIENILNDMHAGFEIDDDAVMEELESMLSPNGSVAPTQSSFPPVPAFVPVAQRPPVKPTQERRDKKKKPGGILITI